MTSRMGNCGIRTSGFKCGTGTSVSGALHRLAAARCSWTPLGISPQRRRCLGGGTLAKPVKHAGAETAAVAAHLQPPLRCPVLQGSVGRRCEEPTPVELITLLMHTAGKQGPCSIAAPGDSWEVAFQGATKRATGSATICDLWWNRNCCGKQQGLRECWVALAENTFLFKGWGNPPREALPGALTLSE